ncbi:MOSC domain-containing protein [Bacillus aerolatus]|uniref:MOSC domain-containing protein n=1 Tax=Bacillus aerolatus TaxID=2653354 RepID=A0A6I1FR61_9BACI|nr:MOSC domain-containing protein [Bacillus aerolatus]KAB7707058.1 MOSC domain-containing protein [Bacillus aerolatus]
MENSKIELVNFAVSMPKKMKYGTGKEMETGICKDTVEEAFLSKQGFRGDGVGDLRHHGGLDRAVCMYSYEHYSLWNQEFQTSLPLSAFGENLTVTNMLKRDVCIGAVYRLGDAVIQITQGRIPCSTITKRTNIPHLLKRIVETGFTGYLCRVLKEGIVRKDSDITLIEPHPKRVSILFGNRVYFDKHQGREGIQKVLEVEELADDWREKLAGRLDKLI